MAQGLHTRRFSTATVLGARRCRIPLTCLKTTSEIWSIVRVPDVNLPFSRDEYADRLAQTHAAMGAAGVDILFAADPSNMSWLTGYDGWSFYAHQGVLMPTG